MDDESGIRIGIARPSGRPERGTLPGVNHDTHHAGAPNTGLGRSRRGPWAPGRDNETPKSKLKSDPNDDTHLKLQRMRWW